MLVCVKNLAVLGLLFCLFTQNVNKQVAASLVDNNQRLKVDSLLSMSGRSEALRLAIDEKQQDFRGKTYVGILLKNCGDTELIIAGSLNHSDWINGALVLRPQEQDSLKVYLKGCAFSKPHPANNLKGMKGLPNGYQWHWEPVDESKIRSLNLTVKASGEGGKLYVKSVFAGGDLNANNKALAKESFFPFVDKYGQYKHKNWYGKIETDRQLRECHQKEVRQIQAEENSQNQDKFGGYSAGPKLKGTGHFRVEKYNGKWWLVTPAGNLFWSQGLNCVGFNGASTPVSGRTHYFEKLPANEKVNQAFWASRGDADYFNFSAANLHRKHGENWSEIMKEFVHERLRFWGVNTIANWSDPKVYRMQKTPYVVNLHYTWPEGSKELSFPNICHRDFKENLKGALVHHLHAFTDPYCIGFFVDNELHGFNLLAEKVLKSSAASAQKKEMVAFAKERFGTLEETNEELALQLKSWEDFAKVMDLEGKAGTSFLFDFRNALIDKYYKTCRAIIKEVAPDKLYLGSRLDFHQYPKCDGWQKDVVNIASQHCDVISFNRYRYSVKDLILPVDKPVMISEFHFGALDRGMFHTGLRSAGSQEQRGRLYYQYVKEALENPWVVGVHWFQYQEQAVTGRFDGENYQVGFVDVCDSPYETTVRYCQEIAKIRYKLRLKSK